MCTRVFPRFCDDKAAGRICVNIYVLVVFRFCDNKTVGRKIINTRTCIFLRFLNKCTCTFLRFCDSKPVGSGTQFACCPVQANVSVGGWVRAKESVCVCAKYIRTNILAKIF